MVDFHNSPLLRTLVGSCPFEFMFPNLRQLNLDQDGEIFSHFLSSTLRAVQWQSLREWSHANERAVVRFALCSMLEHLDLSSRSAILDAEQLPPDILLNVVKSLPELPIFNAGLFILRPHPIETLEPSVGKVPIREKLR